jgi:hypothetical protein
MSLAQIMAIANLQDIFKSWHLLPPLSLWPTWLPAPAHPRVDMQASPSVASPSTPARTPSLATSPAWSPPPRTSSATHPQLLSFSTFQATPQHFDFGNVPSPTPRVIRDPREPQLPSPVVGLPAQEPVVHCTRFRAPAPLALFASGCPYHECIQYHIPTTKSLHAPTVMQGFAGLCTAHYMTIDEVAKFALLCTSLLQVDVLLALSVLNPSIGESLQHCQLHCDPRYKTTWYTLYTN